MVESGEEGIAEWVQAHNRDNPSKREGTESGAGKTRCREAAELCFFFFSSSLREAKNEGGR